MLTYPFVAPGVHDDLGLDADDPRRTPVRLANPLSDEQPCCAPPCSPTLLTALRRNVSRGTTDVRLFEVGMVTRPDRPVGPGDAPVHPGRGASVRRRPGPRCDAAVPPQPVRVAGVAAGHADPAGWWGPGRPVDHGDAVDAALGVARALGVEVDRRRRRARPVAPGPLRPRSTCPTAPLVGHAGELHPQVGERPSACRLAPSRSRSTSTCSRPWPVGR